MLTTFLTLPVYGIGLGAGMPAASLDYVTILDDWFNLKGTQTAPPLVQSALWTALGLGILADLSVLAFSFPGSTWRIIGRIADGVGGIIAAVSGELLLAHVASNQSDNPEAGQTAAMGSMVSVLMLLLILPNTIETVVVVNELVPEGD